MIETCCITKRMGFILNSLLDYIEDYIESASEKNEFSQSEKNEFSEFSQSAQDV